MDYSKHRQADIERKWIRLQEIGLLQLLTIPVMVLIIAYVRGFTITGPNAPFTMNLIILIAFFLATSGFICLKIGDEKRREIQDQEKTTQNTHNGQ